MPTAPRNRPRTRFRIRYALMALAAAILFGTLGFYFIEGWTLADSLYVTVQTLTTVGYGDVPPHTGKGRFFAVVVMLMGAGGVALAVSTIVQSVVQSELVATFGQRRRTRKMSKLRQHYIVCGSGRVGSHLVRDLVRTNQDFVVIEQDLNPKLHIVARAAEEQAEAKLLRAGANHVVAPTIIGGHRMAIALTKPAVHDFMDSITADELGLAFEQVEVDAASALVGEELRATPIRSELDVVIISIRRQIVSSLRFQVSS